MPPKRVILAIVIIAIILFLWSGRHTDSSTELLADRIWVDRVTEEPREMVQVVYLIEQGRLGLVAERSQYRLSFDVVRWRLDGARLEIENLQEDRRSTHRVRTWRCRSGEAPSDELPYCMDLDGKKYFASDEEELALKRLTVSSHPE